MRSAAAGSSRCESAAEISQPELFPKPGDELARRMGVKAPYVASLEASTRNLTLGQLANIADAPRRGLDITFPEVQASTGR